MKKPYLYIIYFLVLLISFTYTSQAQILDKLKKKTEDKIIKETEKQLEGNDDTKKEDEEKSDDNQQNPTNDVNNSGTKEIQDNPKFQVNSKYDFIPGDKVLLFEDFSQDAVGDFPALWTTDVAGEINTVSIAPGNWFNLNSTEGTYWLMQDIDFPKNFILEMDIIPKKPGGRYAADLVFFGESTHSEMDKAGDPGICGLHVKIEKNIWETAGYKKGVNEKLTGSSTVNPVEAEKVNHVIIWVQNRRVRIYHKEEKVLDIPTNIYEGSKFSRLCFKLYRGASAGSFISNIKITTAAPDTRNKLLTEGKLVTYGIYFDVNSDKLKPESSGTLNDIAKVLQENPDVKVKIVGHTDSDGEDKSNLDLSKRRAASVKNALVKDYKINETRLETDGKGEGDPVAPNDNSTNKSLNRRVEFIKL